MGAGKFIPAPTNIYANSANAYDMRIPVTFLPEQKGNTKHTFLCSIKFSKKNYALILSPYSIIFY